MKLQIKTTKGDEKMETIKQELRKIEGKIQACFDGWGRAIKNHQQPVSIQDLDYWSCELKSIIDKLEQNPILKVR